MCLQILESDKKGIIADRDIPCIKLLFDNSIMKVAIDDGFHYASICMCEPVELGKLMVAKGEQSHWHDNDTIFLSSGFIHAYMCEPKDLDTIFDFSIGVRCYIPKGNMYYVDMNYPTEVCSPSLFITDEILFTYNDYKNGVLK